MGPGQHSPLLPDLTRFSSTMKLTAGFTARESNLVPTLFSRPPVLLQLGVSAHLATGHPYFIVPKRPLREMDEAPSFSSGALALLIDARRRLGWPKWIVAGAP